MVDFIHHSEKFSDARWEDPPERLRVLNVLLELVERAEPIPVAAAVSLEDYNALTVEEQRMCRHPYYLAFQTVTSNLGFAVGSKDLAMKGERARADVEADKKGLPRGRVGLHHTRKGLDGLREVPWLHRVLRKNCGMYSSVQTCSDIGWLPTR